LAVRLSQEDTGAELQLLGAADINEPETHIIDGGFCEIFTRPAADEAHKLLANSDDY